MRFVGYLGSLAATFLGLSAVTFAIGRFIPTDPVLAIVGDHASRETYERVRLEMGLDRPSSSNTGSTRAGAARRFRPFGADAQSGGRGYRAFLPGDAGARHAGDRDRRPALGVPAGVVGGGAAQGAGPTISCAFIGLFGYSVPVFWLGLMALLLFYAELGWVAGPGRHRRRLRGSRSTGAPALLLVDAALAGASGTSSATRSRISCCRPRVLGYFSLAYISRMTRSFMLEQLARNTSSPRASRACTLRRACCGATRFGNILVPLVTVVALAYAILLEGAVLTETVFAWPGIGCYITARCSAPT